MAGTFKLDRIFSGFLGFEESTGVRTDDARANEQKVAGGLSVVESDERPIVSERQGGLLEVDNVGLGDLQGAHRVGDHGFDGVDAVGMCLEVSKSRRLGPSG